MDLSACAGWRFEYQLPTPAQEFPVSRGFYMEREDGPRMRHRVLPQWKGPASQGPTALLFFSPGCHHGQSSDSTALFSARDVRRWGWPPLTSIRYLLFGKEPHHARMIFRPKVHDSDGLYLPRRTEGNDLGGQLEQFRGA